MRCSGKTSKFVPQLHDEVNFRCVFVNFVQFDDIWMVQLHIRANLCHQGAYVCGGLIIIHAPKLAREFRF